MARKTEDRLTDAYLDEFSATFNDLARQFSEMAPPDPIGQSIQHRRDGLLETHAGALAAAFLATLGMATAADEIKTGQMWTALAAQRGSVGACNTLANLARAVRGQLLINNKAAKPAE